uniref:Uncharacterized protein n=1 Tax=Coprothermobacter proteolyticus (strain ATCC 35245 / DSM 5265 / OCM 4 / BT) TaxID=309798 RepID=B5Y6B2_COPPD
MRNIMQFMDYYHGFAAPFLKLLFACSRQSK